MEVRYFASRTCRPRLIRRLNVRTPLLVPSFSSVESDEIAHTYRTMGNRLGCASLISAYDLHYGKININDIWESDVIFIDSGNYENQVLNNADAAKWTRQMYLNVLDEIVPMSRVV